MNIIIDGTIFTEKIKEFVISKFDNILKEAFQKKEYYNEENGFGRIQITAIISDYINSDEFKSIIYKYINENIHSVIKELINSEIKRQTKETIKLLISEAILKIKE